MGVEGLEPKYRTLRSRLADPLPCRTTRKQCRRFEVCATRPGDMSPAATPSAPRGPGMGFLYITGAIGQRSILARTMFGESGCSPGT